MSFSVGFLRCFSVLEGYARCRLCGVDLKISSWELATFLDNVQGKKYMLLYSRYRLAYGLPLVDEHDALMSTRAVERRKRLVDQRPVPLLETATDPTGKEVNELEHQGKSVCSSYFGSVTESACVARMWFAFIAEQLKFGCDVE